MTYLCRGRVGDVVAAVEQLPADVHVVARRGVLGIEPADGVEDILPVRHVAARHVLGAVVGEQHLGRIAGREGTARSTNPASGWARFGPPTAVTPSWSSGEREVERPVGMTDGVGIEVRDEITVARAAPALRARDSPAVVELEHREGVAPRATPTVQSVEPSSHRITSRFG